MMRVATYAVIAILAVGVADTASAQLFWNVSVKILLTQGEPIGGPPVFGDCPNPTGGADLPAAITDPQNVIDSFDYANDVLDRLGRGYRFNLIEPTVFLKPPAPPPNGPTDWATMSVNDTNMLLLDANARANPSAYNYRTNALNVYVLHTCGGGRANTRNVGEDVTVVLIGQNRQGAQTRILHELGHTLGACHTHGCPNPVVGDARDQGCIAQKLPRCLGGINGGLQCFTHGNCPGSLCSLQASQFQWTDDVSSDTVCDFEGWDDEESLAQANFSTDYASLDVPQQDQVLDVLFNIMAYHQDNDGAFPLGITCTTEDLDAIVAGCTVDANYAVECPDEAGTITLPAACRYRLTDDQLDRVTDRANCLFEDNVASGRTWFVGNGNFPITCTDAPLQTSVQHGLDEAMLGDIIMIRGGTYAEILDITKPVTIRSSRGVATIRP